MQFKNFKVNVMRDFVEKPRFSEKKFIEIN